MEITRKSEMYLPNQPVWKIHFLMYRNRVRPTASSVTAQASLDSTWFSHGGSVCMRKKFLKSSHCPPKCGRSPQNYQHCPATSSPLLPTLRLPRPRHAHHLLGLPPREWLHVLFHTEATAASGVNPPAHSSSTAQSSIRWCRAVKSLRRTLQSSTGES